MSGVRSSLTVLLLAAGQGKRLKSRTIKLLHSVAGRPMVAWAADAVRALKPRRVVAVVGFQADGVRAALDGVCDAFVVQSEQRGTGHAVLSARREVERGDGALLIVNGDLPNISAATLRALVASRSRTGAALALVTTEVEDSTGYGRILRDGQGRVARIVEHKDATASERSVREINCGIYCADPKKLFPILKRLRPNNAQGEYYLTDAVRALIAAGERVVAFRHADRLAVLGVNTRRDLVRAGAALYARKADELLDDGVTLLDPERTWIDPRAKVGRDTVIYPGVIIEGATVIGSGCLIRSGCRIVDSSLGSGVEMLDSCLVREARIGDGAILGPFAHLRPGCVLGPATKVGNFVELKKTHLGKGSKAPHLTYLGDAKIGERANIGAGTITCNYDGVHKYPTTIDDGVFVGSDTQLVAPVTVGEGAYVAAGSTVTEDVPPGALAISRARQLNLEGWVERRKKKTAGKRGRSDS